MYLTYLNIIVLTYLKIKINKCNLNEVLQKTTTIYTYVIHNSVSNTNNSLKYALQVPTIIQMA